MGRTKDLFALDRQRQDDEDLRMEYAEREYVLGLMDKRESDILTGRDPGDEHQPKEKPARATTQKPHANDH